MSLRFMLNDQEIHTDMPAGAAMLDFIRSEKKLVGTKIGCREGDCGACTVLVGELRGGFPAYRTMTSCLMPLGNAAGKHIVTIEGLNRKELTPVQRAIVHEGATQCGFCTVGFVVSLTGFCMDGKEVSRERAMAAMDGNICRCTGYKSLERAAATIADALADRDDRDPLAWLVAHGFLPDYFNQITPRLIALQDTLPPPGAPSGTGALKIGGGTDLFVQRADTLPDTQTELLFDRACLREIREHADRVHIGGSVTVEDLRSSPLFNSLFPELNRFLKLVSSTPIRNMASVAGNLVNASPIGDMTIFFLALDAEVRLARGLSVRQIPLRHFYKAYKELEMEPDELLETIVFKKPGPNSRFNFEKVSKRTHLDIASVNSAMMLEVTDGRITAAALSAGGVAPIPLFLRETSAWLIGKPIEVTTAAEAGRFAQTEISPISDVRGSATYKSLLLRRLVYAHFLECFPEYADLEALV